ncbi:MAG: glutamine synthetase [Candidatus Glassbacteria bacterium RIFCSPLOWO2_12_FULL_58_11]|uniref:Glutamine synthetase n=1 Tax=Candidatus Glassbacteria bacterium RIFCSPLOWO2_12_FULL_58_11 TaxID=1817867 RepID=A0A1F5Z449_9BACT|nr:MAG: glutamine synthetase [Candidatus Glassbacteria bacterium RIFCSPLOWO2_12_FULL_58_11]
MNENSREYVMQMAREHGVKFIRLWFTDMLGLLKSFAITVEELDEALEAGKSFDGSSIEGFSRIDESDMVALPDPDTFCILPWRPSGEGKSVARMFCDIYWPDGTPYASDPRQVLKRNLQRARDMGYTYYVGEELEYFYFKSNSLQPEVLDQGGYFDLTPLDVASDLRRDTVLTLESMGIPVESSHHEIAPSQQEIDLRYEDALSMADNTMTFRLVVKEVALRHGVYATFMPKPLAMHDGSGMHVHQSLFEGERNLFHDVDAGGHLSPLARAFVAGLLRHAAEIVAITNQWVNSYKRFVAGYDSPVHITWAVRNRASLVRVPPFNPHKEQAVRCEFRVPDPACNPYLALSVMLAAGLEGIEKHYELPPAVEEDLDLLSAEELSRRGIDRLPDNLLDAVRRMESSALVRRCLGDDLFEKLIQNKKIEWERYHCHISEYEMARYLTLL